MVLCSDWSCDKLRAGRCRPQCFRVSVPRRWFARQRQLDYGGLLLHLWCVPRMNRVLSSPREYEQKTDIYIYQNANAGFFLEILDTQGGKIGWKGSIRTDFGRGLHRVFVPHFSACSDGV